MGKSTRTKICGAVLTLAASAFGMDRWALGPPADDPPAVAQAAVVAVATPAGPAVAPAEAPRPSDARAASSVARRLQAVADAEGLSRSETADAFKPSPLWAPPPPPAPKAPPPAPPKVDPAEQFRSRHRLTAVMQSPRDPAGGLAMIDNKFVQPGQEVDGFVLAEVHRRGAVLRAGTVSVELVLEEPKVRAN